MKTQEFEDTLQQIETLVGKLQSDWQMGWQHESESPIVDGEIVVNPTIRSRSVLAVFKNPANDLFGNQHEDNCRFAVAARTSVPKMLAHIRELEESTERLGTALTEIKRFNRIHNDLESYLFDLAEWGLGERDDRPVPSKYGVEGIV
jgi:hypothetical protein